jgi:hypothetical protein
MKAFDALEKQFRGSGLILLFVGEVAGEPGPTSIATMMS